MHHTPALFDIAPLYESISSDSLLLTPNRRLAAQVQNAYANERSQRGDQVWEVPAITPIDDWLLHCWQELSVHNSELIDHKTQLQATQETLLWERIIREDDQSALLKPYATAKQAQAAYRTLQLWGAQVDGEFNSHPDCSRFAHWLSQFEKLCASQHYVNGAAITHIILQAFISGQLAQVNHVTLLGFQHLPPLYEKLLEQAAVHWQYAEQPTSAASTVRIGCDNLAQEIQAAAQWAHHKLQCSSLNKDVAEQTDTPAQSLPRIGIIVPNLAQQRVQIESTLAAVFEPQYSLPGTARYQLPFNISAGIALNQTPLISSALTLLEINRDELSHQDVYHLLRSPFLLDSNRQFDTAAELEVYLREAGWPAVTLEQLQQLLTSNRAFSIRYADLLEAISICLALKRQHQWAVAELEHWLTLFEAQLGAFQWPAASRRLDSIEYQQLTRWQQALQEFGALSNVCGKVGLHEALNLLTRFIANIDFQAQTPQTPIQVLGMLEGSGLQFDALWVIGLNDHLWPAAPSPSPFIPLGLQQRLHMPHASAERELGFARELLDHYQQCSHELVASYALQAEDQPLRTSTLIEHFTPVSAQALGIAPGIYPHPYYSLEDAAAELETVADQPAPLLGPETETVTGGSAILKDQAACPFKAFANHRLKARALKEPGFHVSAAQRGIALHHSLEHLWQQLKDYQALISTEASQLHALIEQSVTAAIRPLAAQRKDLFGATYTRSEVQRLSRLLHAWLHQEKQRSPFEVVATEETLLVSLQQLPLKVRIDRIDRLADGSLMLIDYKTGACSTRQWQGERLEEPQLPLYSVTMAGKETHVETLAFAQINIDRQGFVGISTQEGIAPGIHSAENSRGWDSAPSWQAINQQWHNALHELASQFVSGHAPVDPVNANTCQFCHLHSLCRIHEIQQSATQT